MKTTSLKTTPIGHIKKYAAMVMMLLVSISAYAQPDLSATEKEGTDFYKQGKITEAITSFKKALVEKPASLYAINALGNLYFISYKYQDAYDIAGQGVKLSYNAPNFVAVKAKAAIKLGRAQEAITLVDQSTTQPDFMLLFIKGTAFAALQDNQQALAIFSQSISLKGDFPTVYFERGKVFAAIGRYPLALKDYDKYIDMVDDDADSYNYRGQVYYFTKQPDKAIADYTKCIQLNDRQMYALTNRGIVYMEAGQNDKALDDFHRAEAIDPDYGDPYFQEAYLYTGQKDCAKALPLINKAISLNQKNISFYFLQSKILLTLDKYAEGLAAAEKALLMDPKNPEGYVWKASAFYDMEKYDDAIRVATQGIAVDPGYYPLYYVRAAFYKAKGNNQLADADNLKAKQLANDIK